MFAEILRENISNHAQFFIGDVLPVFDVCDTAAFLAAVLKGKERKEESFGHIDILFGEYPDDTATMLQS